MTLDEFKKQYSFHVDRNIEWADMDSFQHVNNTVYFRYFEKIRIDYFEHSGLIASTKEMNIGPILASTQCRYKLPLTYPGALVIGTYITDLQSDRFLMKYAVYSVEHERVAAEGDGLIVCYDYSKGEKASIPEAIFTKLQSAEQTT
ncbi:MAG: acyl-CoA thioester hydrolase [Gammaproteobacteria bacterium]|jgi:acyl-CoA thioester hydrolase